jgi:hypothetical protein
MNFQANTREAKQLCRSPAGAQYYSGMRTSQQYCERRRRGLLRGMGRGDSADKTAARMQVSRVQILVSSPDTGISHHGKSGINLFICLFLFFILFFIMMFSAVPVHDKN